MNPHKLFLLPGMMIIALLCLATWSCGDGGGGGGDAEQNQELPSDGTDGDARIDPAPDADAGDDASPFDGDGGDVPDGDAAGCVGWQLDETNTGLAGVGIDRSSLPLYEPPSSEVQYGTWYVPIDTVVTEKRIEMGGIILSAGNITFERCWFHPSGIGRGMPLFHHAETAPGSPNVIRDSDIDGTGIALNDDGTNPACGGFGINTSNITIERCNIQGFGSGVGLSGDYPVSLECTYIHDLAQGEWFLGSGESHQDGLTIRSFGGTEAIIQNNRIVTNPPSQMATGAIFLQATWGDSFYDNIFIEGNLLEGYGYNLGMERSNGGYGINMRAVDNRFNPYNGWLGYVDHGPGWAEWRDNYLNDPAREDNKGETVAEPMTQDNPGLASPSSLQATPESGSSLILSWSDNSGDETGFRVGRSPDGIAFTSITMTGADATSYADTGLSTGTTYYYRVAAANGDGMSGYSNMASATTAP